MHNLAVRAGQSFSLSGPWSYHLKNGHKRAYTTEIKLRRAKGRKLLLVSWLFILTHSGFVIHPGDASYLDYSVSGAHGVEALLGNSLGLLLTLESASGV